MKPIITLLVAITAWVIPFYGSSQVVPCTVTLTQTLGGTPPVPPTYNMTNGTISTCSGVFYDPGGTGNYANSIGLTTMTFCSDQPGEQIILDFSAYGFQVETSFDFLNIYDGVGTGGTQLWNSQASGGSTNPGVITSTSGCLTITFSSDGSVTYQGWQADISCTNPPSGTFDCNGGDVTLSATGQGQQTTVMSNNFNAGLGAGWVSTGGSAVGSPCGPSLDGTDYYWASTSTGTPNLTTVSYDVSCGGTLSFDMAYATQGGAAPCEGPDLANEGVTLQYSTDGGATWTVIQYWDPLGGYDPTMTSWNTYTIPIPPGAQTPGTQFQWIQNNSSGTCCDNWGIDNVMITANTNCNAYWYDYNNIPSYPDPQNQTVTVTSTTTFGVWYTNGIDSCYASTTVIVPPGTTADAGPDQTICSAGTVTIGGAPTTPDNGATYTWSTGATGTISGGVNGQINVSPVVTTEYYLEIEFNGCFAYDTVTVFVDAPPTASNPAPINVQCSGDVPAPDPLVVTDENDDITIPPTVTFLSDVSDGLSCPETITRTYRVTDACGNFVDVFQTITVNDTQAPVLAAAPANANYQCPADVPAMAGLGWTDNCDGAGTVAGTEVSDGLTCPETITRTWTYTDACGNTDTETQTITVNDTQAPVLAAAPANANYQCPADVPAMAGLGWTDNCDGAGTVAGTEVSDGLTCPETITRTWTYTDACGNTDTETQTITVNDTQAPVFAAPPANLTVACVGDIPAMTNLGWTDNCDGTGSVAGTDGALSGGCPATMTRTWTYTDACGNTATETQTITVNDTQAPVFAAPPANVTVECAGDVPAMTNLGWTDNCDGTGNVAGTDVSDGLSCPETITRTWTYSDACGNTATVTQTITVIDTQAPVFAAPPANVTVECAGDVPAMTNLGWTDNCDGTGNVTGADVSDGLSCPETITRTWTYTDACGNNATVSQTIIVDDTTPPTASNPAPISVAGGTPIPPADPLVVNDEADNCTVNPTVAWVSDVSDNGNCPEIITRTYSITDECGNQTLVTQLISIGDAILPTASNPAPINVQCSGDVPAPDPLVVTDEADNGAVPTVTFESDASDGLTCPETITRTYRVTDDCGNFIFVTQTITVHDTQVPVFAAPPANATYECIGDVPAMAGLGWTDNCDGAGTDAGTEVSDGLSCPETITRTWTYTDACGNTATETQTITVQDTQAPVFAAAPANATYECIGDVPAMTGLAWTDNCDGSGTDAGTEVSDGLTCPETITRTWTYTDACGNTSTETQIITVQDTQAPVFAAAPANATYECIGDVPAMTGLGWTDNCDGSGTDAGTEVSDGLTCPETITRTWTYTDACGNTSTETQIITVQDTQAPVFAAPPANVTVECAGDVPAMTNLGWTDNCDGTGSVTGADVSDGLSCPETITRTWTYTDACGNNATVSQTIIVDDTTPPTASNPPTTTVPGGPVPPVDVTVVFDEADNCTVNPTVTFVSEVSDNNPCPETITRIYEITDDCGNTTQVAHLILITDPIMPSGTAPAPINVECIGDVPAADPLLITDEADNQGVPTVAHVGDVSDGQTCPETITRTYSITDVCGNQITVDQIITVQDVTAPVMAAAPADVTVECIGDVPAMINLGWTDNCDGAGTVTGNDVSDGLSCPETITRTWTYTDACGNTSTETQTITVIDTQAPVFDAPPADITIDCTSGLLSGNVLTWTDNCDGTGAVLPTDGPLVGGTCGGTITRTWTYTDNCGNNATVTQTITVNDTQAPVLDPAPANVTVQCIGDVPAMIDLGWTDNCDGAGTVTGSDVSDGLSCPETITRTWTYTDNCGNTTTTTQTIVVDDTTPPTASNPAPISVPGPGDVPAPDPTVVINEADNCTANPVVAFVSAVSDGNVCNGEIITHTYSVTDDCGNQILVTHEITILATPAPIDAGNDTTICLGENVTIVASNPWGAQLSWSPQVPQGPFAPTQTTTYTVTADNYGCISTDQITVTVEEPPVVSFLGDVLSGCSPLTVNFTNTSTATSGIADCEWTINGTTLTGCNPSYTFNNGGTYDVTLSTTSTLGCTSTDTYSQYIYVEDDPIASFIPSSTVLSSQFTGVNFDNTSTGATSYQWDFGTPGATSTDVNPSHTYPEEPGTYNVTLTAYTDLGCMDEAYATIVVEEQLIYYIPNTFTPDGDDYNETFKPIFTEGYDPFDFHLLIFNRWGEIIWESYDASVGWDGTYGTGGLVQDGTYNWKLEFKVNMNDERKYVTGHVNLIR